MNTSTTNNSLWFCIGFALLVNLFYEVPRVQITWQRGKFIKGSKYQEIVVASIESFSSSYQKREFARFRVSQLVGYPQHITWDVVCWSKQILNNKGRLFPCAFQMPKTILLLLVLVLLGQLFTKRWKDTKFVNNRYSSNSEPIHPILSSEYTMPCGEVALLLLNV